MDSKNGRLVNLIELSVKQVFIPPYAHGVEYIEQTAGYDGKLHCLQLVEFCYQFGMSTDPSREYPMPANGSRQSTQNWRTGEKEIRDTYFVAFCPASRKFMGLSNIEAQGYQSKIYILEENIKNLVAAHTRQVNSTVATFYSMSFFSRLKFLFFPKGAPYGL